MLFLTVEVSGSGHILGINPLSDARLREPEPLPCGLRILPLPPAGAVWLVLKSMTSRENCIWELQIIRKRPTFEQISLNRHFSSSFACTARLGGSFGWRFPPGSPPPPVPTTHVLTAGGAGDKGWAAQTGHPHPEPGAHLRAPCGCGRTPCLCPPQSPFGAPQPLLTPGRSLQSPDLPILQKVRLGIPQAEPPQTLLLRAGLWHLHNVPPLALLGVLCLDGWRGYPLGRRRISRASEFCQHCLSAPVFGFDADTSSRLLWVNTKEPS